MTEDEGSINLISVDLSVDSYYPYTPELPKPSPHFSIITIQSAPRDK